VPTKDVPKKRYTAKEPERFRRQKTPAPGGAKAQYPIVERWCTSETAGVGSEEAERSGREIHQALSDPALFREDVLLP